MEDKKNSSESSASIILSAAISAIVMGYFVFVYKTVQRIIKKDNFLLKRFNRKKRIFLLFLLGSISYVIYYVTPTLISFHWYFYGLYFLIYPMLSVGVVLALAEEIYATDLHYKISPAELYDPIEDSNELELILN
ncbi:MAG: hypothetical protein IT245_01300, partial [Bacteroidia bacterium]|nr:hypothetical protein [Bacteroidia bacterium]